ncbi:MAG TPA: hypothetical protein VM580_22215, partial [Labilithrix sp.]|nr:hypothetical protein [Labilithrix sp.]
MSKRKKPATRPKAATPEATATAEHVEVEQLDGGDTVEVPEGAEPASTAPVSKRKRRGAREATPEPPAESLEVDNADASPP